VANSSQAFDAPFAWGWADFHCGSHQPFMCKTLRPHTSYVYISPSSMHTYVLNTSQQTFVEAQYTCNQQGGHLVHYGSVEEQQEVEQYFSGIGAFIPVFHRRGRADAHVQLMAQPIFASPPAAACVPQCPAAQLAAPQLWEAAPEAAGLSCPPPPRNCPLQVLLDGPAQPVLARLCLGAHGCAGAAPGCTPMRSFQGAAACLRLFIEGSRSRGQGLCRLPSVRSVLRSLKRRCSWPSAVGGRAPSVHVCRTRRL
jgi:hypothetical protein